MSCNHHPATASSNAAKFKRKVHFIKRSYVSSILPANRRSASSATRHSSDVGAVSGEYALYQKPCAAGSLNHDRPLSQQPNRRPAIANSTTSVVDGNYLAHNPHDLSKIPVPDCQFVFRWPTTPSTAPDVVDMRPYEEKAREILQHRRMSSPQFDKDGCHIGSFLPSQTTRRPQARVGGPSGGVADNASFRRHFTQYATQSPQERSRGAVAAEPSIPLPPPVNQRFSIHALDRYRDKAMVLAQEMQIDLSDVARPSTSPAHQSSSLGRGRLLASPEEEEAAKQRAPVRWISAYRAEQNKALEEHRLAQEAEDAEQIARLRLLKQQSHKEEIRILRNRLRRDDMIRDVKSRLQHVGRMHMLHHKDRLGPGASSFATPMSSALVTHHLQSRASMSMRHVIDVEEMEELLSEATGISFDERGFK